MDKPLRVDWEKFAMIQAEEMALEIVNEWKLYWFSQEEAYQRRAMAIDANMRHDLKRRIAQAFHALASEKQG